MYNVYLNEKSKEVLKREKLDELSVLSMIQKFLKEEYLDEEQDIICILELPDRQLALMGHKIGDEINIIHTTTKIFVAR